MGDKVALVLRTAVPAGGDAAIPLEPLLAAQAGSALPGPVRPWYPALLPTYL